MITAYSVPSYGDHFLNVSGASSGAARAVRLPAKVKRGEFTPAVPAVATEVVKGEVSV